MMFSFICSKQKPLHTNYEAAFYSTVADGVYLITMP